MRTSLSPEATVPEELFPREALPTDEADPEDPDLITELLEEEISEDLWGARRPPGLDRPEATRLDGAKFLASPLTL